MDEECQVIQNEELEVLNSIYEGDSNFIQLGNNTFQYKYVVQDTYCNLHLNNMTFLLNIEWSDTYPNCVPNICMDAFFNREIDDNIKKIIIDAVSNEAEQHVGTSMTYTLFEFVRDNVSDLLK